MVVALARRRTHNVVFFIYLYLDELTDEYGGLYRNLIVDSLELVDRVWFCIGYLDCLFFVYFNCIRLFSRVLDIAELIDSAGNYLGCRDRLLRLYSY